MLGFNVWITESCNMRCSYCYENGKTDKSVHASIEMLDEIMKFIWSKVRHMAEDDVVIDIHGGEPLLEFDKVVYFVEHSKRGLDGHNVFYNIGTNGTLLDKEKAEWLNVSMNSISVSLDGNDKTHNRNRKYINGNGTYADVIQNINDSKIDKKKVRIRMTVNSKTVENLSDSVSHIVDMGFWMIVPAIAYEDECWNKKKLEYLEDELMKVKMKYKNRGDVMIAMTNRDEIKRKGLCGGGITKFDILPNGDIYPCSYVCGLNQYKLGNVCKEMKIDTDKLIVLYTAKNQACDGCTYVKYCLATRCKYLNKLNSGDYNMPSDLMCRVENIKYRVCSSMADA